MAVVAAPGSAALQGISLEWAVVQVRRTVNDEFDGYIVVSFSNATLVLSIGETVEEVQDSGFLATVPTLRVQLLQDNSLIQVRLDRVTVSDRMQQC